MGPLATARCGGPLATARCVGPLATARCVEALVLARELCIAAGGEAGGEAGQAPPLLGPIPRPQCSALWAPRCAPLPPPRSPHKTTSARCLVSGRWTDRQTERPSLYYPFAVPSLRLTAAAHCAARVPPLARARRCPSSGGALRGSRPQDDRAPPRAEKMHGPRLGPSSPIYNWFILVKERAPLTEHEVFFVSHLCPSLRIAHARTSVVTKTQYGHTARPYTGHGSATGTSTWLLVLPHGAAPGHGIGEAGFPRGSRAHRSPVLDEN